MGLRSAAIYWQNGHPFFRDRRVRQALTLAINRRELLQVLNLPTDAPLLDGPATVPQLLRGELPAPLPYDPARARTLLEEAGWRARNGDAVRERQGRPFRFTALLAGEPSFRETAVYVQAQLRRVGIDMGIQVLDSSLVRERVKSGQFEAAFFDIWSGGALDYFRNDFPLGYKNAKVVELINRLRVTADPEAQDRMHRELMEIFRADVPVTCLFLRLQTLVAHRRIRGLNTPFRADLLQDMENLWLEDRSN